MSELELDKNTERKVLVMATLHDLPETVTSDIPHDVKERFPEFDKILKKIEDNYYMENYPKYYYDMCTKNDLVIGILRLADAYSVKQFCLNEMELGNNSTSINKILSDVEARISKQTIYLNILYEEYKEDAKNAQEQ